MAFRNPGDAVAGMADDFDQSRPDAMQATDVMLMGRLGPNALAAGGLGLQSLFRADDLRPWPDACHLPDDGDGAWPQASFRARPAPHRPPGPLAGGHSSAFPSGCSSGRPKPCCCGWGRIRNSRGRPAIYVRWLQWAALPFYAYIVLRSFISALERPGWALAVVFAAVAVNAVLAWCFMFGRLGFPAMGIAGAGLATTLASVFMFVSHGGDRVAWNGSSAAIVCSDVSGAPTGRALPRC